MKQDSRSELVLWKKGKLFGLDSKEGTLLKILYLSNQLFILVYPIFEILFKTQCKNDG